MAAALTKFPDDTDYLAPNFHVAGRAIYGIHGGIGGLETNLTTFWIVFL
jgi:hypothetical protein